MAIEGGIRNTLLASALGFAFALGGTAWQQYWTANLERTKTLAVWLRDDYAEYLSTMDQLRLSDNLLAEAAALEGRDASAASAKRASAEEKRQAWDKAISSSAKRIAVFGSAEVVVAIAEAARTSFERTTCGSEWRRDLNVFHAMRAHAQPNERRLNDQVMAFVTIHCVIPDDNAPKAEPAPAGSAGKQH